MPLVRFQIRNEYGLGAQELYKETTNANKEDEPKAVLDGVAVAGLVGILRQLGDLAEFAAEVFHGLQEQVVATASKSHRLLIRVQHIEQSLPPVEKAVLAQTSHIHFAYTAGSEWHPKIRVKHKHLINSDLPNFIMDSYEECHEPPRLHLLDKFDTGGPGACLRRYSDPSFFRKTITRSEPMTAKKVRREKRFRKSKKRSLQWRNGGVPDCGSVTHSSSRLQFGSPNSYGQSSTCETVSTVHAKSRSDQGDQPLFDSRTMSGYIDCVFGGSSSIQQEYREHNGLPTAMFKVHNGNATHSVSPDEETIDAYDTVTHESLQGINPSSVTWHEKTEIVEPKNAPPDNIVVGEGASSEFLGETHFLDKDFSEASIHGNIAPEDIMCINAVLPESLSEVDEFDEVGREPDKYADALNTLDSEAETDSECQTKREVDKPLLTMQKERINTSGSNMAVQKSKYNVEFNADPSSSSDKQVLVNYSNWAASEDLIHTQAPQIDARPSDPNISVTLNLTECTGVLNISTNVCSEPSVCDASSSLSRVPDSQSTLCDSILSGSQEPDYEVSKSSSVNVWTNGGLLGLAPSKPGDYNVSNGEDHNSMAFADNTANGISNNAFLPVSHSNGLIGKVDWLVIMPEQKEKSPESHVGTHRSPDLINANDLHSDQLPTRTENKTQAANHSGCLASYHDKQNDDILEENSLKSLSTVSDRLGKSKDSCQSGSLSKAHVHNLYEQGGITSENEVPVVVVKCSSSESTQKNTNTSMSSGLSERSYGNGYVKTSFSKLTEPHCVREVGKSEVFHHVLPEQSPKNQLGNGSPGTPLPSSPPLEHMKISFYPVDGFETSKLRLKFPGGYRFHESIKDVIFPSFQLLPEPALMLQDSDSESDNDTFCRSSPYLSEELTSQHSELSSEQWDSDDTSDSKDTEKFYTLHQVSSVESISSDLELEGTSHAGTRLDNVSGSRDTDDDINKFPSDMLFDLPTFDSVSSLASKEVMKCDSPAKNHQDPKLQCPSIESVPFPPPLPPVGWRVTNPHSGASENGQPFSKVANCPSDLLVPGAAHQPSKSDSPKHQNSNNDITDRYLRSEQGHQQLYGKIGASQSENLNDIDGREDLLTQIRSKSFSLKRTVPTMPTLSQSFAIHENVTALIEKSIAIRQSLAVGQDENWSD